MKVQPASAFTAKAISREAARYEVIAEILLSIKEQRA